MMMNGVVVLSLNLQTRTGMRRWSLIQSLSLNSVAAIKNLVHLTSSVMFERNTWTPKESGLEYILEHDLVMNLGKVSSYDVKEIK